MLIHAEGTSRYLHVICSEDISRHAKRWHRLSCVIPLRVVDLRLYRRMRAYDYHRLLFAGIRQADTHTGNRYYLSFFGSGRTIFQ